MPENNMAINTAEFSLEEWFDYIQTLHHREIELSLERVKTVYNRMHPSGLRFKVISVAGTNGKGSTSELISSIYRGAGYQVGKFTSPHLINFNERFNLNGKPVSDKHLLNAFINVEANRKDTPITFFEYGTLVAVELFVNAQVDIAVMEIGLGGRLDSVNILDPDIAIVTSVSIDHAAWLGDTIDKIAYEKVGIARANRPLLIGFPDAPKTMLNYAKEIDAELNLVGQEFGFKESKSAGTWEWFGSKRVLKNLPLPFDQGDVQLANCSLALQSVDLLSDSLPVSEPHVRQGIVSAHIDGRCQIISKSPLVVLDVAHNQASVARLSEFVSAQLGPDSGRVIAICGMLADKQVSQSLESISSLIDSWHVATIHNERGAKSDDLDKSIKLVSNAEVNVYDYVVDAFKTVKADLKFNDCLVVFGSFHIVGDILSFIRKKEADT